MRSTTEEESGIDAERMGGRKRKRRYSDLCLGLVKDQRDE
jgi:hypothetical protein